MIEKIQNELQSGFAAAYIDSSLASNLAYKPEFISNNHKEGKKVLSAIEEELLRCDFFQISVAFITMSGITPLLQTFRVLEQKGIKGEILTTNYLNFSEPRALKKLQEMDNITIRMYNVEKAEEGFHTKGYIFKEQELYKIIIGSSNMTSAALTSNKEWNTKIISTGSGEVAKEVILEFQELWNSKFTESYDQFYDCYKENYQNFKEKRDFARLSDISIVEKIQLKPNGMQTKFISSIKDIIEAGEKKALLISATGTGKTYASAFAMRELEFKRVLFLVHRGQLARQTKESYERVFNDSFSMGLLGAGSHEYEKDYVFATIQTLNREKHLNQYKPDDFDCIVLDEAHHSSADTYQKVMDYFHPKLWLGMTATPDKRIEKSNETNIYEIFNYQIAYEIRLQQAMEENMLCPFHYFGISDITLLDEKQMKSSEKRKRCFNNLVADERVKHIVKQAEYYGYSGDRVKGLIFCSRIDESIELSRKFNTLGFRTIALNGDSSEEERASAFERLAMNESSTSANIEPLDYIFSVEILNEGVDIVEVNQVIMLRPTESPIVFIQQLGRGLRKAEGKEFVVILDFIGNYSNNFMIPVALSGDRTYNPDTIRKYVISGNNTIPGASTVHFDEIAKEKVFRSIDKIRGIKSIIRESYITLKNRIGCVPYMLDFYSNGEMDPLVIVSVYKTYNNFLSVIETMNYSERLTSDEQIVLEYLTKTILSGVRPYELVILKHLIYQDAVSLDKVKHELVNEEYMEIGIRSIKSAMKVLQGCFISKDEEYQKFRHIDIFYNDENDVLHRTQEFSRKLQNKEFFKQITDIVDVGLKRYKEKYEDGMVGRNPIVLYEKYTRRDISLIFNCEKDFSSTMYGMKRIGEDVFIFVTYHKSEAKDEEMYVEGKPDYADVFEDNLTFRWDSQIGKGISSNYVKDVTEARYKHLLVKKSDAELSFYYMGEFDITNMSPGRKKDNNAIERDITKIEMRMKQPVRDDVLRYLQTIIKEQKKNENNKSSGSSN